MKYKLCKFDALDDQISFRLVLLIGIYSVNVLLRLDQDTQNRRRYPCRPSRLHFVGQFLNCMTLIRSTKISFLHIRFRRLSKLGQYFVAKRNIGIKQPSKVAI